MKSKTHQAGSAHVIIVAVLVVALIGALGWVFWQNINGQTDKSNNLASDTEQSKADKANDNSLNTSDTPEDATVDSAQDSKKLGEPDEGYFAVKAWGIQFKQPNAYVKYYTNTTSDGAAGLGFTTKAVQDIGGRCAEIPDGDDAGAMLVYLTRQSTKPGTQASAEYIGKVGDYYYTMSNAQGTCSEKQQDVQIRNLNALKTMAKTVKALN